MSRKIMNNVSVPTCVYLNLETLNNCVQAAIEIVPDAPRNVLVERVKAAYLKDLRSVIELIEEAPNGSIPYVKGIYEK